MSYEDFRELAVRLRAIPMTVGDRMLLEQTIKNVAQYRTLTPVDTEAIGVLRDTYIPKEA